MSGTDEEPRQQYAVIAWRRGDDGPEVLLITSRDTGRWVIPKGWPMSGREPWEAASIEAYEEAGVRGVAFSVPSGDYGYDKRLKDGTIAPCRVEVFLMPVTEVLDDWPEKRQRQRRWFSPAAAAKLVDEPELAALLVDPTLLVQ